MTLASGSAPGCGAAMSRMGKMTKVWSHKYIMSFWIHPGGRADSWSVLEADICVVIKVGDKKVMNIAVRICNTSGEETWVKRL